MNWWDCCNQILNRPFDPVTWYGINYAGMQVTQWDFQNKGKLGWTGTFKFLCFESPTV